MISIPQDLSKLSYFVFENTDLECTSRRICKYLVDNIGAKEAAIYLYNRKEDEFDLLSESKKGAFKQIIKDNPSDCKVIKSYRKSLHCGTICIRGSITAHDDRVLFISKLVVVLFNRKFSKEMFDRVSRPIDYLQDETSFHSELQSLAEDSSQMPAGAMRVFNETILDTVFSWNNWISDDFPKYEWDIEIERAIPSVKKCIDERAVVVLSDNDLNHDFFDSGVQKGVKSAIFCPVLVGSSMIGILSFALPIKYDFSEIEQSGFLSLANSIGVALTNFSRSAAAELDLADDVKLSQILTAVEVAQAARHSARADLDTLKTFLLAVGRLVSGGVSSSNSKKVKDVLSECDTAIASCFKSLDDIKSAIRPPAREIRQTSLKGIFENAKSQLRGRIIKNEVSANWIGADVEVECYPDHLKQVFLNLLLNSVDAFGNLKRKKNRNIRCRVEGTHENTKQVKLRFEDDAGGVDVAALMTSADDYASRPEEAVFAKDVTSKGKDGSGWGLYVSRKIVNDHGGHIALIEYRNRTVFEMTLQKKM